ncbi:TetR/AcrR family transcriptional regulator [Listeria ivanovii]|uniref:TetR/AcrR family transcriptional regulator n=2 Tax=Listeria ivanovii TaxID=1638 RepID=A0ABS1G8Q7_LISIV|nr:TetR/AcrR family transcriptional regulator [Listeria ivanovii]AIS61214.1 TetR family transcriptional regulator [Listeria ivanovii subsp. londoniensis]AIS64041.1 TetR family transcriptional regulator [Listeria ivanovii subsp. londoniensis]MBC2255066.1 TetR/AcrR family transcriptional regulator [Listeria ivanovii]MBK1963259.1 TetR/AcrR family transcriptional regulator [Listeria ivanovii subsp. londoniensis]MBK1967503.1 TetR/AcrR family transcriptional regulator [Listeria ivanovii subsp. londo
MQKKRTRAEELAITRRKILDTASDLFMEKGYRAVSTREIANRVNITQPALYHHFEDKEALYIEVVRELTQQIQIEMQPLLESTKSREEQLRDMLIMLIEKHPTNILLMIHDILNEMKPENQYLLYKLWQQTYLIPFQKFFQKQEATGELREGVSAEVAARYCLATISPLFSGKSEFAEKQTMTERIEELIDLMMFGISKKEV